MPRTLIAVIVNEAMDDEMIAAFEEMLAGALKDTSLTHRISRVDIIGDDGQWKERVR